MTGDSVRDYPYSLGGIVVLEGDFIVELEGPYFNGFHTLDGKVKHDGLFDPFVDDPLAVRIWVLRSSHRFGDPEKPLVQLGDNVADGVLRVGIL
jgi:hypothetical protein